MTTGDSHNGSNGQHRLSDQVSANTVYPYLPRASVAMTSAKAYLDLLTGVSP